MTSTRLAAVSAAAVCALALLPGTAAAATITPNSTDDDFDAAPEPGPSPDICSLREAIQNAVNNTATNGCAPAGDGGTDTIRLTSLPGNPYTISVGSNDEDVNAAGDFDVGGNGPIVIRGTGQTIDTIAPDRIFDVKNGADLTLENLEVSSGNVTSAVMDDRRGGNIRANSTSALTLNDVVVRLGDAGDGGGGIFAATANQLTITDSEVRSNDDARQGGGLFVIGNAAPVQISRTVIAENEATTAENNVGSMEGAGVWFFGDQMTITDSEITDNDATHNGTDFNDGATGGGILTGSDLTIRRSLITGNDAAAANGNEETGGAIQAEGGEAATDTVNVINSTIYDNEAGDASNSGDGGAVYTKQDIDPTSSIDVVLSHVTLAANRATQPVGNPAGDHLETATAANAGTISLRGSVITSVFGVVDACDGNKVSSAGFNVTQYADPGCAFIGTDATGVPSLGLTPGVPVDNGGFTDTIALQFGSPAMNFVPAAQCGPAEGQDQRGYPRPLPVGGACDAGAYELHSCDGSTIRNGAFVACPVMPSTQTPATPPATKPKKCKKKKKRKKGGAAAKRCKKKKKKKR